MPMPGMEASLAKPMQADDREAVFERDFVARQQFFHEADMQRSKKSRASSLSA